MAKNSIALPANASLTFKETGKLSDGKFAEALFAKLESEPALAQENISEIVDRTLQGDANRRIALTFLSTN